MRSRQPETRLTSGGTQIVNDDVAAAKTRVQQIRVGGGRGGRGGRAECLAEDVLVSGVDVPGATRTRVDHQSTLFTAWKEGEKGLWFDV